MTPLKYSLLVLSLLLAACVLSTPDNVAKKFCTLKPDQPDEVRAMLSKDLVILWDRALAYNDAIAKAHPDEKPPLGDGIQIQTHPDHAPICRFDGINGYGQYREAWIYRGFPDDPGAGWTDRLVLIPQGRRWVINDIIFGPDDQKGPYPSLAGTLHEVLEDKE